MVVTKVFQIKTSKNLKLGLNYIEDKEKTNEYVLKNYNEDLLNKIDYIVDNKKTNKNKNYPSYFLNKKGEKQLVSVYGLNSVKYAYDEMLLTKENANKLLGKTTNNGVDVLAHHIIQSFSPEDKLTPEEVHEIGRKTILELTGGEHEFVIATHLDKKHLHNHIIFNTTNNVTLKKFRWKKGTKKSLENISDKYADIYGAKIIDREKIIDHKKYEAYKKQHTYRYELKERLKFLIKHSNTKEDFLKKAKLLNILINDTGKELKFKLTDSNQKRYIRENTLSKKGYYSKNNILNKIKQNTEKIPLEKIKELYNDYKKEKEDDFEIRFKIENWQILNETKRGIYIEVNFGIKNSGTILIPNNKIEKEGEDYEIYIKRKDYFYFINAKKAEENRYITGTTLAKQLSKENGENVIYKNYYVGKIEKLIEEFNYLSKNNITGYDKFKEFQDKFNDKLDKVEKELERLDIKIAELNKLHSALEDKEKENKIAAENILKNLKISSNINKSEVKKLLKEVIIEREILNNKFKNITSEYKYTKELENNIKIRKETDKIDKNKKI